MSMPSRLMKQYLFAVMMSAAAMVASASDSATSPISVIDSRLRTSGSAAAPQLEARSGHAAESVDVFNLDTATSIGTLIMFR